MTGTQPEKKPYPKSVVETPDGKTFRPNDVFKPFLFGLALIFRVIGKFIITVWRLAGALDSALWNGFKLALLTLVAGFIETFKALYQGFQDLFAWLPSKAGRSYSALAAVFLIIFSLAIGDEIRNGAINRTLSGGDVAIPIDEQDPILARIDGRYVHLSEVEAFAKASSLLRGDEVISQETAFRRGLVATYIEQKMLANAAHDTGLSKRDDVAVKLSVARDRILASSFIDDQVENAVTDERVLSLYQGQRDVTELGDEVKARHIVVANEIEAVDIITKIAAGADFSGLARENSIDRATAPLGGELGYFTRDMMTPILSKAAFDTPVGEIAPIFFTEFGWHILEVSDRRETNGISLVQVEDRIRRFLRLNAIEETITVLKTDTDVVYYDPRIAEDANNSEQTDGAD